MATRLKRGKFGSRLLAKLAGVFAMVGVVPGLLIYGVSYQFVTRSIDTWFDVQVAQALDAGLSLGRSTLDAAVADLSNQARTAAERLADARQLDMRLPEGKQPIGPLALERTRQQLGVRDAVLLGANGQVLASAGGSNAALVPERPAASHCCARPGCSAAWACSKAWTTNPRPVPRPAPACVPWPWCPTPTSTWRPRTKSVS